MAMGKILSIVSTVGIAGTITLGALTTWDGTALTNAKTTLLAQADKLGVFHTNEGRLLNKVSDLNAQIKSLNDQIATLQGSGTADQTQIASLQAQVSDLTSQLNKAKTDLASAQTNGNALAQRVDDLQAQLDAAQSQATDLQSTVTTVSNSPSSDTAAVDNAVGTSSTTSSSSTGTSSTGSTSTGTSGSGSTSTGGTGTTTAPTLNYTVNTASFQYSGLTSAQIAEVTSNSTVQLIQDSFGITITNIAFDSNSSNFKFTMAETTYAHGQNATQMDQLSQISTDMGNNHLFQVYNPGGTKKIEWIVGKTVAFY